MEFLSKSKELHKSCAKKFWRGAFDDTHDDTRRHHEMLKSAKPFILASNCSTILTVSDNLCREAGYIKKAANCRVTASDLMMGEEMNKAVDEGFVDEILSADIENLPFEDNSIDLVFAKEAFHHWPRPMLGLYEMLRVAKKCIVLIEPIDNPVSSNTEIAQISYRDTYENVGNYKYQVSIREILKSAWSLYLPAVAFTSFNDPFKNPFSFDQWLIEKKKLDQLGREGKRHDNLLAFAIYKTNEGISLHELEENRDITLVSRPLNPYIIDDRL